MAHTQDKQRIVWEGPVLDLHSIAQVNRELCLALDRARSRIGFDSAEGGASRGVAISRRSGARRAFSSSADRSYRLAHVRHEWPPSFVPPPQGHWVIIQPWEFGSVPRRWVLPMATLVDEVWAYSNFVRDSYIAGGVPAERVHVVPLGVDQQRFHPEVKRFPLKTSKPFRFLFVGGTIHRKGIDVLLRAYSETFTAEDPVCLVIKDIGGTSFYRGQTVRQQIALLRADPQKAEIEYIEEELGDDDLPALYTACHCLVQPYRGEGFCLPIAEAMACGVPVIVTGHGAALDYCSAENAFLIPARIVRFREKRIGDLETVDYPFLAEPDPDALRQLLRLVVDHPDEARTRAAAGLAYVHKRLTWDHAVRAVEPARGRAAAPTCSPIRAGAFRSTSAPCRLAVELPSPHFDRNGARERQRVSLCMIVKNEAAHLAASIGSVADLVDDVVVVDTGSTDDTAAIAARLVLGYFRFNGSTASPRCATNRSRMCRASGSFGLMATNCLTRKTA